MAYCIRCDSTTLPPSECIHQELDRLRLENVALTNDNAELKDAFQTSLNRISNAYDGGYDAGFSDGWPEGGVLCDAEESDFRLRTRN